MIGKQKIGSGFRGLLDYLRHGTGGKQRERGRILDTNLPASDHSPRAIARSFGVFRRLNEKLRRAVYHVSLSPAPGDVISDDQWREIAEQYLTGMGFEGCGFVLIKHDDEAEGKALRPPHVHLLACRIRPDGTTVSDQNNYRRSEKLVREIEARFGLVAVASPKRSSQTIKPKEGVMNNPMKQEMNAQLRKFAEKRLEEAAEEAEATMIIAQSPVSFGIEPAGTINDSVRRDYKREILEQEYQQLIRDTFAAQVRFVRKSGSRLVLHFYNGGRVVDSGDKVTAHAMPSAQAAEACIELAILKGWDGVILTGNDDFLKEAFTFALSKGLAVKPKPEQLVLFTRVREEMERQKGRSAASQAIPAPARSPTANLRGMSGPRGLSERLADRSALSSPIVDSAPRRPRF